MLIALVTLDSSGRSGGGRGRCVLILGSDGVALAARGVWLTTVTGTLGGLCFVAGRAPITSGPACSSAEDPPPAPAARSF